jgi:hypothetical protein
VTTTPALDMADLLETAAALATEQHAAGRRLPRLIELALFMRDFSREVRAPYLPAALVQAALAPVTALARLARLDGRYRTLRGRPATRPVTHPHQSVTAQSVSAQRLAAGRS